MKHGALVVVGVVAVFLFPAGLHAFQIEFDSPADLALLNPSGGAGSLIWGSNLGVAGGGALSLNRSVEATYDDESFSLTEVGDVVSVSSYFKTGQLEPVNPGNFLTYGSVYLTPNPGGYPFDDDHAFVEIRRNSTADQLSGGPLQQGGGSFPGFTESYSPGTLLSDRWYKLGVEFELLASGQLGWDVRVEDFGPTGQTPLGSVMTANRVISDTLGLRFDQTLYAGFSAFGDTDSVIAMDRFAASTPPGPPGELTIGPAFDVAYQPGDVSRLIEGETSLLIGGFSSSTTTPVEEPIIEFPLADLPAGARIESAQLRFSTNGSSGSPRIMVKGYEGDGLASLQDGEEPGVLVALTGPESCCDDVVVPLFTNYVQALASRKADYLGLRLSSADLPEYITFRTEESTFGTGPSLEITYSMPGSPGDFNGDGGVDAADYTVWRDTMGSSSDLRADADGSGVVDQVDLALWKANYGASPPVGVVNSDFETGDLTGWEVVSTPNSDISFGFPRVDSLDVNGDGTATSAMRIRVGQDSFLSGEVAGGGIRQLVYLDGGDYSVSADIASQNIDIGGNTGPGRFELWLAGQLVDVVDLNGQLISPGQVIRDRLDGLAVGVDAGWYDLEVRYLRGGTNSRAIYGYFDNITFSLASGASAAVPEPTTLALAVAAVLLGGRPSRRRR